MAELLDALRPLFWGVVVAGAFLWGASKLGSWSY